MATAAEEMHNEEVAANEVLKGDGKENEPERQWVKVNQKTLNTIDAAYQRITEIEAERKELNAKKKEIRAGLEHLGVNLIAFDAACKYRDMNTDKRNGFDLSYAVARMGLGQPLQDELFEGALREEMKRYAKKTH